MSLKIGVDVGGTNLRIGVVRGLEIIDQKSLRADFSSIFSENCPDIACNTIVEILCEGLSDILNRHERISSIGIGFPGFIDPQSRSILSSPNLPGLNNFDLAKTLHEKIHLPVQIENDALAATYGEYLLNNISSSNGLIYIGLGTGVGGGLVLKGQAIAGEHGFAMEIGHIIIHPNGRICGCGNRGCLEQYASATGICKSYSELEERHISADEIAKQAKLGDLSAQQAYVIAARSLAQAIAHILKIIDVERVIIGGGVTKSWDLMQLDFNEQLNLDLIKVLRGKVQIDISNSQDQAGIIGASFIGFISCEKVSQLIRP